MDAVILIRPLHQMLAICNYCNVQDQASAPTHTPKDLDEMGSSLYLWVWALSGLSLVFLVLFRVFLSLSGLFSVSFWFLSDPFPVSIRFLSGLFPVSFWFLSDLF